MLYTIFWVIIWLFGMSSTTSFSITMPQMIALIVALIADVFVFGYWQRGWIRKP